MDIGPFPGPGYYLLLLVDQPAQFDAHDSAVVALSAHLSGAATLPGGVDQFYAEGVDDGEEGGVGQKAGTPTPVGCQGLLQSGAFR